MWLKLQEIVRFLLLLVPIIKSSVRFTDKTPSDCKIMLLFIKNLLFIGVFNFIKQQKITAWFLFNVPFWESLRCA